MSSTSRRKPESVEYRILTALADALPDGLTSAQLAARLGIDARAIGARASRLYAYGDIDRDLEFGQRRKGHPNEFYRYRARKPMPTVESEILSLDDLAPEQQRFLRLLSDSKRHALLACHKAGQLTLWRGRWCGLVGASVSGVTVADLHRDGLLMVDPFKHGADRRARLTPYGIVAAILLAPPRTAAKHAEPSHQAAAE